eukprot:TRINITY_DN6649_c0_g1_i11.p1 TRINITY_DN6649_c0_g1~~TRINITY_DN6649_c0_g1_i11.p1  ORF type:complete len:462 (-),score=66.95 TRINITY_DN6649_c0_g1_i11:10-1338(-)
MAYRVEKLDDSNKMKCEGCNEYVQICRGSRIEVAPNVLVVQLKRFAFLPNGRVYKINKEVAITEKLDLSKYMADDAMDIESPTYTLYGVVEHFNLSLSLSFGHYICYVKAGDGNWYMCNDEKVAKVDLESVLNSKAYLLFYQRDKPRQAPDPQFHRPQGYKFSFPHTCVQPTYYDVEQVENIAPNGQIIVQQGLEFNNEVESSKSSSSSLVSVPKTESQWIAEMEETGCNTSEGKLSTIVGFSSGSDLVKDNVVDTEVIKLQIDSEGMVDQNLQMESNEKQDKQVERISEHNIQCQNHQPSQQQLSTSESQGINLDQECGQKIEDHQEQDTQLNQCSNQQFSQQQQQSSNQEFDECIPDYTITESEILQDGKIQRFLDVIICPSPEGPYDVKCVKVEGELALVELGCGQMIQIPLPYSVFNEYEVSQNDLHYVKVLKCVKAV